MPESGDELGATTHALESPYGMVAKLGESLRTKGGELMVLPIPVFHRVKLRSIGRQVLKTDSAVLFGHEAFNQPTMVGMEPTQITTTFF